LGTVICPQCGAEVSDQFSSCPYCRAPISMISRSSEVEKQYCANCRAEIVEHTKFCYFCGKPLVVSGSPSPISVELVLSSSLNIILKNPLILLPMLVEVVISMALTRLFGLFFPQFIASFALGLPNRLLNPSFTQTLLALTAIFTLGITLQPIVYGMYPLMVKNTVERNRVDLRGAFVKAVSRFPSILVVRILVSLIVGLGTLFLIVPGLYLLMGYYVTIPAVMLEDRGGRDGMSASMSFSRNRKWKIFGLLLITSPPAALGTVVLRSFLGTPVPFAAYVIFNLTIVLVLNVLGLVMCSYTYIRYGMAKL